MRIPALAGVVTSLALLTAGLVAAPAQAAGQTDQRALGSRSLAKVLAADANRFDSNWRDFDIVDRAIHKVLAAKPDSPVGVLAKGKQSLTAFVPTDAAFRRLVTDLTGHQPATEKATMSALVHDVAMGNITLIESILLYHVVPGATITAKQAVASDGAKLTTALMGSKITVHLSDGSVFLVDGDSNSRDPKVVITDINKGNVQIAHGINRVLRPMDLPPLAMAG